MASNQILSGSAESAIAVAARSPICRPQAAHWMHRFARRNLASRPPQCRQRNCRHCQSARYASHCASESKSGFRSGVAGSATAARRSCNSRSARKRPKKRPAVRGAARSAFSTASDDTAAASSALPVKPNPSSRNTACPSAAATSRKLQAVVDRCSSWAAQRASSATKSCSMAPTGENCPTSSRCSSAPLGVGSPGRNHSCRESRLDRWAPRRHGSAGGFKLNRRAGQVAHGNDGFADLATRLEWPASILPSKPVRNTKWRENFRISFPPGAQFPAGTRA